MNHYFLLPLGPLDERGQPPQRIDIQREHLRQQQRFYKDFPHDPVQPAGRRQLLGARIWQPIFFARRALGRALVAVGRQLTTDTSSGMGGASTATPKRSGSMQYHS